MLRGTRNSILAAVLLAWPALTVAQGASLPALDSAGLLPPSRDPADVPSATDKSATVPAVPMNDVMRQAIRLFDSGPESKRFYDFANCVDGLTFGFGNWPQPEIGTFFEAMTADQMAWATFIKRSTEVFSSDQSAWSAFKTQAAIRIAATPTEAVIQDGLRKLLAQSKMKRASVTSSGSGCKPVPARGIAFYQDNESWFVPIWSRAGRDPVIVAFQVSYWDVDVLTPAMKNAEAMNIDPNGMFLLAFYQSNPGQAPELKSAIKAKRPPSTLQAGGQKWEWNNPPQNLKVDLDSWHNLLLWQAMCPPRTDKKHFRIRSRNVTYFKQYLSPTFHLPMEKNGVPDAGSPANCDPSQVTLRAK